jgi:hypothetical protein
MGIATTRVIGTLRAMRIIRGVMSGVSTTGGAITIMNGASIIGGIMTTMIGRVAEAGVIVDEPMSASDFTRARIRVA